MDITVEELQSIETRLYAVMGELKSAAKEMPHLYERWKAGGFLVDTDIVSMYPNAEEVIGELMDNIDEDEEEDCI